VQYVQERREKKRREKEDQSFSSSASAETHYADPESVISAPDQIQKPILYNLPHPHYGSFVGREKELRQIVELLKPKSRSWVVVIDGIGGIGKSTLALEVANQYLVANSLPEAERFEAIVWVSAKQSDLTLEGVKPRKQFLRTLDDIYNAIAITLKREDVLQSPADKQDELVRNILAENRTLLIVDNLEAIDDVGVMNFLRDIPTPTKALVTTRHRIDIAYPIRLGGLPYKDSEALVHHECQKKNVVLKQGEVDHLIKRTGGVPLAIVWSIAQIGFGYTPRSVLERLGSPTSDIIRFCFDAALSIIVEKPAYRLLTSLSIFPKDADREVLGRVSGLLELDRDDGLIELERLSLINKLADRFSFLPLTRTFALNELAKDKDLDSQARLRLANFYVEKFHYLDSNFYQYFRDEELLKDGENILEALEWSYDNAPPKTVWILTLIANEYLDFLGRWNEIMAMCDRSLELAYSYNDTTYISRIANVKSWLLEQQGKYEESLEILTEIYDLAVKDGNDERKCLILGYSSALFRKLNRIDDAFNSCDQARQIAELDNLDIKILLEIELGSCFVLRESGKNHGSISTLR
jgi:LuxR family glucitol operon transcriptional activator